MAQTLRFWDTVCEQIIASLDINKHLPGVNVLPLQRGPKLDVANLLSAQTSSSHRRLSYFLDPADAPKKPDGFVEIHRANQWVRQCRWCRFFMH